MNDILYNNCLILLKVLSLNSWIIHRYDCVLSVERKAQHQPVEKH